MIPEGVLVGRGAGLVDKKDNLFRTAKGREEARGEAGGQPAGLCESTRGNLLLELRF